MTLRDFIEELQQLPGAAMDAPVLINGAEPVPIYARGEVTLEPDDSEDDDGEL